MFEPVAAKLRFLDDGDEEEEEEEEEEDEAEFLHGEQTINPHQYKTTPQK